VGPYGGLDPEIRICMTSRETTPYLLLATSMKRKRKNEKKNEKKKNKKRTNGRKGTDGDFPAVSVLFLISKKPLDLRSLCDSEIFENRNLYRRKLLHNVFVIGFTTSQEPC
jgi:hypothetical protein